MTLGHLVRWAVPPAAVAGTLAFGAAVASAGGGPGQARFGVPDAQGRFHASTKAVAGFDLPTGWWDQEYGGLEGTLSPGNYTNREALGPESDCGLSLSADSRARSQRPDLRPRPGAHLVARGTKGKLRWRIDRFGGPRPQTVARAYAPTPRGVTAPRLRWTTFEVSLHSFDGGAACDQLRARTSLRTTITSMRVERGSLS